MSQATITSTGPWYRSLTANQWKALLASNLGWTFDGYETFALILSVGVAMRQLLDPSQYSQIPAYIGWVIGITLLGWGVGESATFGVSPAIANAIDDAVGVRLTELPLNAEAVFRALRARDNKPLEDA